MPHTAVSKALTTLALTLCAALCMAQQPARPPAGVDIHEQRPVRLLAAAPSRCIAMPLKLGDEAGVVLLLDKDYLEVLSNSTPQAGPQPLPEADRLQLIKGRRAQALLASASQAREERGCQTLAQPASAQSRYLVGALLEEGQIFAVDGRTGAALSSILVTYAGSRCGDLCGRGFIQFAAPGGRPFFVMDWWVS